MKRSRETFFFCAAPLALAALLLGGCTSSYDDGYKEGYNEGQAKGLDEGYQSGSLEGRNEGLAKGAQRAEEAAASGRAFTLYSKPFALSFAGGVLGGVVLQYALLYFFRSTYRLHWLGTNLVPGLSNSRCFRLQIQLGVLAIENRRQLDAVRGRAEVSNAKIEAVKNLALRQVEASGDLDSVRMKSILNDAERKLQSIVEEAERRELGKASQPSTKRST
jgi:hypothetical protein